MPEYIEREALLKHTISVEVGAFSEWDVVKIEHIINAPAADVVEVVRCKDCEYYEAGKAYTPYCNNVMNLFEEMKPDDFCSYGEMRRGKYE